MTAFGGSWAKEGDEPEADVQVRGRSPEMPARKGLRELKSKDQALQADGAASEKSMVKKMFFSSGTLAAFGYSLRRTWIMGLFSDIT